MTDEMNGSAGVKWATVLEFGKWFLAGVFAVATVVGSGIYFAGSIIQEFRAHTVAAELKNEEQDGRLDFHDTMFANHETRIDGVEISVVKLGPEADARIVENAISLVHDAIECEMASCDKSCWVAVPGASGDYLNDELRVRVEEHFRRLDYEVSRERQLPTGRLRSFWIFVEQAGGGSALLVHENDNEMGG